MKTTTLQYRLRLQRLFYALAFAAPFVCLVAIFPQYVRDVTVILSSLKDSTARIGYNAAERPTLTPAAASQKDQRLRAGKRRKKASAYAPANTRL